MQISKAMDARARYAAGRKGLIAHKSRWRLGSSDNLGGYMLLNDRNCIVAGERFDLTAEDVIAKCKD